MKRLLVPIIVLAGAACYADVTPFSINVNYAWSNSFDLNGGGTGRISGLEFGVSQSVVKLPLLGEARLGVSALMGGFLKGGNTNGTVYRVYAWYKSPMAGPSGFYGLGGFHYASAQGSNFDTTSGFGIDAGIGIPLKAAPIPGVPSPAIEIIWHQGAKAQTRGFSVGINVKF